MTDYVIHLTRMVVVGDKRRTVDWRFDRLVEIIKTGILLPTFGICATMHGAKPRTVKGEHKAVCYTEQPLEQIYVTLGLLGSDKYMGYGLAVYKADLYAYGGRHAIYGDYSLLCSLPDEYKYLWVRYEPSRSGHGSPVDWTFEREWRCRVANEGLPWEHKLDGVPLLLPDDFRRVASRAPSKQWVFANASAPDFRIIVRWDTDVKKVRDLINSVRAGPTKRAYHRIYYAALQKAQIISLEHVERKLEEGDDSYRRIEDLPSPDEMLDIVPPNPQPKVWPFLKRKRSTATL